MNWHQKNTEALRLLGGGGLHHVAKTVIHWDQRRSVSESSVLAEHAPRRLAADVLIELLGEWFVDDASVINDELHIYQDGAKR